MFALPGSSFLIKKIGRNSKKDIKWLLKLLRLLAIGSSICCLCLFMQCDEEDFKYAGGNVKYDNVNGINTTWDSLDNKNGFSGYNPDLYGTCSADFSRDCKEGFKFSVGI
jgi:hypothetical protein